MILKKVCQNPSWSCEPDSEPSIQSCLLSSFQNSYKREASIPPVPSFPSKLRTTSMQLRSFRNQDFAIDSSLALPQSHSRLRPTLGFESLTLPDPEMLSADAFRTSEASETFTPSPSSVGLSLLSTLTSWTSATFSFSSPEHILFAAGRSSTSPSSYGTTNPPQLPSMERLERLIPRLLSDSFGDRRNDSETLMNVMLDERFGVLAAIFRSEEVVTSVISSSVSMGVGRSERGRLPRTGRRGRVTCSTGEGDREGSFSFDSSFWSSSTSS